MLVLASLDQTDKLPNLTVHPTAHSAAADGTASLQIDDGVPLEMKEEHSQRMPPNLSTLRVPQLGGAKRWRRDSAFV